MLASALILTAISLSLICVPRSASRSARFQSHLGEQAGHDPFQVGTVDHQGIHTRWHNTPGVLAHGTRQLSEAASGNTGGLAALEETRLDTKNWKWNFFGAFPKK
ncbi:hypothetical protein [Deinococcus sp.]|uniref:hypothetical protein n=1 Tax=Deinococcus sp. TaxID=47478 RepID=UPI003C7C4F69